MRNKQFPDPDIDVTVGNSDSLSNMQDVAILCQKFGADEIEVEEDVENMLITVFVDGLSAHSREALHQELRQCAHVGVAFDVVPFEKADDNIRPLTDKELLTAMRASPDGFEPGDDVTDYTPLDYDMEALQPLLDEYGSLEKLAAAINQSSAKRQADAHALRHVPQQRSERDETETTQPSNTGKEPIDDPLTAAKQAYISGDIGILELEDRLEDAIELEHEPTAHPT